MVSIEELRATRADFRGKTIDEVRAMAREYEPAPPPASPINREELLRRLPNIEPGVFSNPEVTRRLLPPRTLIECVRRAEWFDFGAVNDVALEKAADDARPLREHNVIRPPFEYTVFRHRQLVPSGRHYDLVILAVDIAAIYRDFGTSILVGSAIGEIEVRKGTMLAAMSCTMADTLLVSVTYVDGPVCGSADGQGVEIARASRGIYEALWLMLNTRGIEKIVDAPSEKLNRARAKAGKPPLKRVTRINATQYLRALAETERTGGRGSPRMHLRRAHIRWFRAERYSPEVRAKPVFIEATIVNGDDAITRDHYEVRR